jgi:hypothetical protein
MAYRLEGKRARFLEGFRSVAEVMPEEGGSEKGLEQEMRKEWGPDIDEDEWLPAFIEAAVEELEREL